MKITVPAIIIFSVFCLMTLHACSDTIFLSGKGQTAINGLQFEITGKDFTVTNKTDQPVYYFVVERAALPSIYWVPISTDENKIEPQQKVTFALEELRTFNDEGDISFFYWEDIWNWEDLPLVDVTIPQIVIDPKTRKANKL